MTYRIRHGDQVSEEFKSLMGILAGDTLSPLLWILYFADFHIPTSNNDILLNGTPISHLEQADDLLLLALSPQDLQRKMDIFYRWCQRNFMVINAIKSNIGIHGRRPRTTPTFFFASEQVQIVDQYTYVGMSFHCGDFTSFQRVIAPHYTTKAAKARTVAHGVLHIESMIGCLPVDEGRILYMGCIDPHLTYGCEVSLDTSPTHAKSLNDVQTNFLRRLLGMSRRSVIAALYTETGVTPILYRRLELALRYFLYALLRPTDTYVHAAIMESIQLCRNGHQSWFSDLLEVLKKTVPRSILPIPHLESFLNAESTSDFHEKVRKGVSAWVEEEITDKARKLYLLQARKEPNEKGNNYTYKTMCMRQYLEAIKHPRHRKAFTKILCSDHPLAVERLRWTDNHRVYVPYEERLCRFCFIQVETPEHALLACKHVPLVELRDDYFSAFYSMYPTAPSFECEETAITFLGNLLSCKPVFPLTAKYIFDVLCLYESTPLYVPPAYRR